MCGRFRQTRSRKQLEEHFDAQSDIETEIIPRYNIAPSQPIVTVRQDKDKKSRRLSMMRWGLIPSWASDASFGNKTINARSETVNTTFSFRHSIKTRRCLVPADGFYEWQKTGKAKQPYLIEVKGDLFAFAGLWDEWKNPEGQIVESFTILTTTANSALSDIHDRMPVIVNPDKYSLWLNPDIEDFEAIKEILCPYDPQAMTTHPVSTRVNQVINDDAGCSAEVEVEEPNQKALF